MKTTTDTKSGSVLVGLSGGMDSAAAVLLLRDEMGFERIEGLYLDMTGDLAERHRAEQTAERLGIELHVEPLEELFRQEVIEFLLHQHRMGMTPGPCTRCNPAVKWRILGEAADRLGFEALATGHYVRVTRRDEDGLAYFMRGADPVKDQSYYLWGIPQELIRRAVMPLGNYTKEEVRRLLKKRYDLGDVAERRESMGVCFLKDSGYSDFLKSNLKMAIGEVLEEESGDVVGKHEGYPLYTLGQKRGFKLFPEFEERGFAVVRVDARENKVYVSDDPQWLHSRTILLKDWQVMNPDELIAKGEVDLSVMVRGLGRNPQWAGCRVKFLSDALLQLELLHDSAWAVAPGQPCALYLDGNQRLVGGGIIAD